MYSISKALSEEFGILKKYSDNIISLFDEGATVPFIARYRKESSGGMSDLDLRLFHERWQYLTDLEKRKAAILNLLDAIDEVPEILKKKVQSASSKVELEDLYSPYKKTRKNKADEAIQRGLKSLAAAIWSGETSPHPVSVAQWCQQNNIKMKADAALDGIESIYTQAMLDDSEILKRGRELLLKQGYIASRVLRGKASAAEKFRDYFQYDERVSKTPPHRLLALFRGKKEGLLKITISLRNDDGFPNELYLSNLNTLFHSEQKNQPLSPLQRNYLDIVWKNKLHSKLESDVLGTLKEKAEEGAIKVFSDNLKDLLMAAPAGGHRVIGVDPGFRNGVKLAVINEQGDVLDHQVIYPHPPQNRLTEASETLRHLIQHHQVNWAAIGNGTASRETETLLRKVISQFELNCQAVVVSEAGASVYSASPVAIEEFPDLDVTIRGAISIARRFQDPLAELVKIDPQAIGVGQYQHDVKASNLSQALSNVVEDCVNSVGVDLNLASASLLSYVSGLSERLAKNILDYRQQKGRIESRRELLKVKGIGEKCFEQCAGFLRILNGKEVLDQSGVHPESYIVVESMAARLGMQSRQLLANTVAIAQIKQQMPEFANEGSFTYQDILSELAKPGRDPRPEFHYASFDQQVQSIEDLQPDMELEGVVTNVAAFGAFVDLGVHQDGLIHISQLANRFVKDPRDLVRVGQVVKVTVLEIDVQRKRIALKANGL
ncbi:Tex family protein [Marinomonas dokdonensis]|uniref:Tex family protein n=1 Tax=Marinomonas dokdonensis TaxID=328224 RepID=UPI0040553FD2